jgi:hypothetical protein
MRASLLPLLLLPIAACGTKPPPAAATAPAARPLASLVAQRVVVTPTYALALAPDLDWGARIGRTRDVLRTMDADIAAALDQRGLRRGWVLPPDLAQSYTRNPTYASDPYALAMEPLRAPTFATRSRLPEPLASQLRTMIALHENVRLVLAPVELRLERAAPGSSAARATLRVALLDPRFSEARWVGDVRGDSATALTPELTASVARRLVDLIAER